MSLTRNRRMNFDQYGVETMNRKQRIAIEYPTLLAIETSHPRFTHNFDKGTIRITVNSGYE